jgi:hypothetical protein
VSADQRQRLLARPRPSIGYPLQVVDQQTLTAAQQELGAAQADLRQVILSDKPKTSVVRRKADQRVAAAQAALDLCYETITLTALPTAGELTAETLAAAHPPTDAQMAKARQERQEAAQRGEAPPPWPVWNDDTFRPALLAACCTNGMTAEDWAAFLGQHVSTGEANGIWLACLAINQRERVADPLVIPKGSTQMLSSLLS